MELFLITAWIVYVLIVMYTYTLQYARRSMPPGPFVLPVIGNILSLFFIIPDYLLKDVIRLKSHEWAHLISNVYGPIFSIKFGMPQTVVISSYDIAKEVLQESQDSNNNKIRNEVAAPEDSSAPSPHNISGHWSAIKKYSEESLPHFRLGEGYTIQRVVGEEISKTICIMKEQISKKNGMTQILAILNASIINVVRDIVEGKNCAQEDPDLENVHSNNNFENSNEWGFFESSLITVWNKVFQRSLKILKTIQRVIERKPREGANGSLHDIHSDGFLNTSDDEIEDGFCYLNSAKKDFRDDSLKLLVSRSRMIGRLESAAIMENIRYILRFLSLHPQVQRNCQNEIDSYISRGRIPTLDDIKQLVYFHATLLETHRLGNTKPIFVTKRTSPCKVRGYNIPKDTLIAIDQYSIHMNEEHWTDPHNVRPERFINRNGQLMLDKCDRLFGFHAQDYDKECLVNYVVAIYAATLLQHFNFDIVSRAGPNSFIFHTRFEL